MAELHVQPKERSMLPWLLAALVLLALLVWWFMARGDNDGDGLAMTDSAAVTSDSAAGAMNYDSAGMGAMPAAVQQLDRFITDSSERAAAAPHEYAASGLRQLADAIEAVARDRNTSLDVQQRLSEVRQRAEEIQRDATASTHALKAREAFLLAANLIRDAHANSTVANAASTNLQQAAEEIDANRPLLDQTSEVRQFFERSARSLRDIHARVN